jgi:hypothetical protein
MSSHAITARLGSIPFMVLMSFAVATALPAFASPPTPGLIDPAQSPLERRQVLVALSATLVETAQSAKGHASAFRIDVAHYRESLRDLVKDNDKLPERDRLPKPLVLDMVRMVGLLQSAAQCQTGRYIVCPPDLMSQLNRQQALMEQGLAATPAGGARQ